MKPPFTSTQEMYNYAANQLIVQNLSQETVKNNLMERGVTDADAEIVIQNMMVQIEKDKPAPLSSTKENAKATLSKSITGRFANTQEMYNYAANQLIVQKLSEQTVRKNLIDHDVEEAEADLVIKNMRAEIEKDKPVVANAKKSEGKRMILVGLIVAGVGAALSGTNFNIAGETYAITYGILAIGALLFFRGLIKMF